MKGMFKSYLVFTSLLYRIVMYGLLPIGAVALGLSLRRLGWAPVGRVVLLMVFLVVEVLSDHWLFGGIQSKEDVKSAYLRASGQGIRVMWRALAMDQARRFASALLLSGIGCLAMGTGLDAGVLFMAVAGGFLSTVGVFLTRFGDILWGNFLAGYGMAILWVLCWALPGLDRYVWAYIALFAVLGLAGSAVAVGYAVKKVEGSYYGK